MWYVLSLVGGFLIGIILACFCHAARSASQDDEVQAAYWAGYEAHRRLLDNGAPPPPLPIVPSATFLESSGGPVNRTKFEWCDYTWNPVTGCWGPGGTFESFIPAFWAFRCSEPAKVKKPSRIFVCSRSDLFGDWVPREWLEKVIGTARFVAPHHTYIFLTKNPRRYQEFNPWPDNCWLGTPITNQADAEERVPLLLQAQAPVRFVSVEPMLGFVKLPRCYWCGSWGKHVCYEVRDFSPSLDWLIIGAMTGPGSKAHKPKPEWVQSLIELARATGVPLFLKNNLKWPEKIQEWPNFEGGRGGII